MQAQQIMQARKAMGMTQEELARQLHVSRQTVSHWENGRVAPSEEAWKQLCQVLNIAVEPAEGPAPKSQKQTSLWLIAMVTLAVVAVIAVLSLCLQSTPAYEPDYGLDWYRSQTETAADQPMLAFIGKSPLNLTAYMGDESDLRWDITYTIKETHQQPLLLTGMVETFWDAEGNEINRREFDLEGVKRFFGREVLLPGNTMGYNVYCNLFECAAYTVRMEGTNAAGDPMAFGWLVELIPEMDMPITAAELSQIPSTAGPCALTPVENPAPLLQTGFGEDETEPGWFYGVDIQNTSDTGIFTPVLLTEYNFANGYLLQSNEFDNEFLMQVGFPETWQPGDCAPFIGGQMYTPDSSLTQVGYQLTFRDEAGQEYTVAALVDVERP